MPLRLRVEPLEDRLTPAAGQLDPTFGSGGLATLGANGAAALTALPDGGAAVVFEDLGNTGSIQVERFRPDGTPDPAFGTNGFATFPAQHAPGSASSSNSLAVTAQPDGRVVVADNSAVIRLTTTGALDPTFGTNGVAALRHPNNFGQDPINSAVHVQPDGTITVVGDFGGMLVNRLTAAGQPVPMFGPGYALVDFPVNGQNSVSAADGDVTPDGKVVLVGQAAVGLGPYPNGRPYFPSPIYKGVMVRLNPDGNLDPTFGSGGRLVDPLGQSSSLSAVRVLPTGQYLVAGNGGDPYGGVAGRVNPDGTLDATYGSAGVGRAVDGKPAILPDGRVVFSGSIISPGTVNRLTQGGQVDPGFGSSRETSVSAFAGPGSADPAGRPLLFAAPAGSTTSSTVARLLGDPPPAGFVPAAVGTVQAGGPADGTVGIFTPTNGTYAVAGRMAVFPGFTGTVRTATADVTGDGTPDYIDGAGPGGQPGVVVFDGKTGSPVANFLAFEATFAGGVFVAAVDLDGDGKAEVIVAPDQGGGPRVEVFSVAGGAATLRANFYGIDDPNFRGGARVAAGDFNHDGTPDLAVAAGFLGGPRVALFDGTSLFTGTPAKLVNDFFAFTGSDATTLRNGVFVAAGDVNGDGFADLIAGGGPGGGPRVLILDGMTLAGGDIAGAYAAPVANFFVAGNGADRGGVRVAVTDADGDGRADVVTGSGEGSASRVRVYAGMSIGPGGEPAAFQDLDPFGAALPNGVFVG
jgi:uncharacterized delta-60 repeat protein